MKKVMLTLAGMAFVTTALMANDCGGNAPPSSDQLVKQHQETNLAQAARDVGMPAIVNYTEKRLVKQLYEMRDNPSIITYTYVQGIDGRLTCLGQSVGYGIPYATQYSNPQQLVDADLGQYRGNIALAQAEPNGLFPPSTAMGTWVFLYDPDNKQGEPTYIEPNVTVSRFKLTGPAIAKECP